MAERSSDSGKAVPVDGGHATNPENRRHTGATSDSGGPRSSPFRSYLVRSDF
jgi:hypothetical protein